MAVLGVIGVVVSVIILAVSVPGVVAGIGLLKYRPWSRMLTIVLSALDLLNVPIGTALGIYGLWVLLSPPGEALFHDQPPVMPRPSF
jgi:hypothetical protein